MSVQRPWAWPLVPLYGAALAAADSLRAAGMVHAKRLHWPVISVGSVSAGGAGKTPLTMTLAKLLAGRGWNVDVLSRGYRRSGKGVERVDPGLDGAAVRFGDEPVLIAQRTGVPVWVGASRYAAGRIAETQATRDDRRLAACADDGIPAHGQVCAHILDDGLQHRALQRQFDLVLVTAADLGDTLLPAGNLREPLRALRRADALAVREEELDGLSKRLRTLGRADVPIWTVRRSLHFPGPLGVFGAGLRPLAFCGLARPEDFAAMLAEAGCGVVDTVIFPDHHRYEDRDVALLVRLARGMQASGLVTTEKDAVKLSQTMRRHLQAEIGPLLVVELQTNFVYESPVVRALEQRLKAVDAADQTLEERVR